MSISNHGRRRGPRAGFNLIEIMIAMFILAMGLIMMAGSMPLALRNTSDSVELTSSALVARDGVHRVLLTTETINFSTGDGEINWYSPFDDQNTRQGAVNTRPMIRDDAANWGVAIPCATDERYAYQIFYRRKGATAPYDWEIFVAVQVSRDGRFPPPVLAAEQNRLALGDLFCDVNGIWRRFGREGVTPAGMGAFRWGIPGGVMVYQSTARF